MKKRLLSKVLIAGFIATLGTLTFLSCERQRSQDDNLMEAIANSPELEKYIIAGYELQAEV